MTTLKSPDAGLKSPDAGLKSPDDEGVDKLMERDEKAQERDEEVRESLSRPEEEEAEESPPDEPVEPSDEPAEPSEAAEAAKKPTLEELMQDFLKKQSEALQKMSAKPEEKPSEGPAFEFFQPTEEDVDDIIEGGDKAKAVLSKIYQRALSDSIQISSAIMQQVIQPLQAHFISEQIKAAEGRFFSKYKDLEPVADLVREVANKLIAEANAGRIPHFKSEDEFFAKVSETTNKFIAGIRAPSKSAGPKPSPPPMGGDGGGAVRRTVAKPPMNEDAALMRELAEDMGLKVR